MGAVPPFLTLLIRLDMKLVIRTQIAINYGLIDESYWKPAGGNIFIIKNLTSSEVTEIQASGIPNLKSLIEISEEFRIEKIISWTIFDDDVIVGNHWENPFELIWYNDHWMAYRTIQNTGIFHNAILCKIEEYDMVINGKRDNYRIFYVMRNGDKVHSSKTEEYFNQKVVDNPYYGSAYAG